MFEFVAFVLSMVTLFDPDPFPSIPSVSSKPIPHGSSRRERKGLRFWGDDRCSRWYASPQLCKGGGTETDVSNAGDDCDDDTVVGDVFGENCACDC